MSSPLQALSFIQQAMGRPSTPRSPRAVPEPPAAVTEEEISTVNYGLWRIATLIPVQPLFTERPSIRMQKLVPANPLSTNAPAEIEKPETPSARIQKKLFTYLTKQTSSIRGFKDDLWSKWNFPGKTSEVAASLAMKQIKELFPILKEFLEKLKEIEKTIKNDLFYNKKDRLSVLKQNSTLYAVIKKQTEMTWEYFDQISLIATAYFETLQTFEERPRGRGPSLYEILTPRRVLSSGSASQIPTSPRSGGGGGETQKRERNDSKAFLSGAAHLYAEVAKQNGDD